MRIKNYLLDSKLISDMELGKMASIKEPKYIYMIADDRNDVPVCFSNLDDAISYVHTLPIGWCYSIFKEQIIADYDYQVYNDDDLPGDLVGLLNYDSTVYVFDNTDKSQFVY